MMRCRKSWRSDGKGIRYVLDADISGFFDNLSHKAIMRELSNEVADGNILRLVEKFLKAGVMEGGKLRRTRIGTPQGGVASPLLANIALNAKVREITRRSHNLDAEMMVRLNRVIRGTANYFVTP